MSYSLGRDAFAVDTHVRRVFRHLGLVESRGIKADHDPFQDVVPAKLRSGLHVNLIHHGRAVCHSDKPACSDCVLVSWCKVGRARAGTAKPDAAVAVDLFSGAGGMSTGFQQEGFRTALAVELDRHAAQSYRANHPGVPVIERDVRTLRASDIREAAAGADKVDIVLAGPPCQGYSAAGKRQPEDGKNILYREVSRIAEELDAEYIVMENVLGARQVNGKGFVDSILRSLRRRRYRADWHVLNAIDFDVPQRRRRLVFIARQSSKCRQPPGRPGATPTEDPAGFLRRKLEDLPAFGVGIDAEYVVADGKVLLNASTMRHSAKVVTKISGIAAGKGPISYRRLSEDAARTLIAGHRALPVHPWLHRTISVREAARIQGFDDDFVFCGPRAEQPLQVANAVPPPMAAGVARSIVAQRNGAEASSSSAAVGAAISPAGVVLGDMVPGRGQRQLVERGAAADQACRELEHLKDGRCPDLEAAPEILDSTSSSSRDACKELGPRGISSHEDLGSAVDVPAA